jgi:hypothetical protein
MKAKEIRKATKNLSFENGINFIENLGFDLELIQNFNFCKAWSVKNNKEIYYIFCTMSHCENMKANITFLFND